MKIYSVGPDELSEYDLGYLNQDAFEWFVYSYVWYDSYSAGGQGVALRKEDGKLYYADLGHCSCYGPINSDWLGSENCTIEEFLNQKQSESIFDYTFGDELKAKVRELIG
jgi:hypothetical protein